MDIYTALIFGVIVIVCIAILASISLFGMKTKTYDEAKAEKRTVVEPVKTVHHQKQKKNKKSLKKTKETKEIINNDLKDEHRQASADDDAEEDTKVLDAKTNVHVEFQEPEIILIGDEVQSKKNQKKKANNARPILVNKEEVKTSGPPSTSSSTTSLNHFEAIHPKDDLEKAKSQLAAETTKPKPVIKPTKAKLEAAAPKEVKVTKAQLSEPEHTSSSGSNKSHKKKKSELAVIQQLSNDDGGVGINVLEPLLTKAQLSRSELQFLIDLLLNKQHGPTPEHTEWFEGRSDPVQKLKKQLAEKEKALTDEQEKSLGIQAKLRELRTELNAERSRINATTRNYEQTIASKTSEVQQLSNKLQIMVESHNAEKHTLGQQLQQYQAKLTEEHNAVIKLQEEQKSAQELLAQRQQYETHIVQLKENEAMLNQQLHQLHSKLLESKNLQEQLAFRDQQLQEIIPQLEESRHKASEIEQRWMHAQRHENELKMEIHRLQSELRASKDNLSGFAAMESEMNRLSMLNNKHEEKQKELIRKNEDVDRLIGQLKSQVNALQNEKENLSKQVTELTEMQNGANSHDTGKSKVELLNLQNALDSNISQLKQVELENNELKNKVSQLMTTQNGLQSQLDELKEKNDDLRTKNWNVMEALQTKEKLVMELTKQHQQPQKQLEKSKDAVTREAIELVKRIMPENTVSSKDLNSNPEDCLNVYKQKIFHLVEENTQLASTVNKYKKIVMDTEGVLNNLQSRVETTETRWQERFAEKEAELQTANNKLLAQQCTSNISTNGPTTSL